MSVKESDVEMVRAAKAARNTRNLALALHSAEMGAAMYRMCSCMKRMITRMG